MTVKDAEPTHGQEEEDGAYLRRRVRLLEREVSRLQETVKRLTMERTERAAEVLSNDSEEQEVRITSTRGMKGNAPGAPTGAIIAPPPYPWSASRRFRCPDGLGSNVKNKKMDKWRVREPRNWHRRLCRRHPCEQVFRRSRRQPASVDQGRRLSRK